MSHLFINFVVIQKLFFLAMLLPPMAQAQIIINSQSSIFVNSNEPGPIQKAVADLASDSKAVFGSPMRIVHDPSQASKATIWISFKHDVPKQVTRPDGWEKLHLQIVHNPWPGSPAHTAVVLTGSDMRGTIYAIYQFSQQFLDVDPLYWWTDHAPPKRQRVEVPGTLDETAGPAIRYRGLFINDEDLLTGWTPGISDGTGISLKTWNRIFEAILRLKGNLVVPGTWIFPYEPQIEAAAERGLIIGQHHVNVLGLDTYQWPSDKPYSFSANPGLLEDAWRHAIREYPKQAEVIQSVGYRGQNDRPFWTVDKDIPPTDAGRAHVILSAIDKEIEIIREQRPNSAIVMNAWREAAGYIREGVLKLPKGVTLVWPDDGHGFIEDGGDMAPGQGVYYHVAMMDDRSNHYTEMVPPKRIQHELGRAVQAGATRYLLLNTANLRPVTMTTRAVMELAWNPRPWLDKSLDESTKYLRTWAAEEFGSGAADALVKYYRAYFAAPARYGQAKVDLMGDNFYHSGVRRILLHLMGAEGTKQWNQLNVLLREKSSNFAAETALIANACREADARWSRAIALADAARGMIPENRRNFFQAQVLTQVESNAHSNRMLLDVAEAAQRSSTSDGIAKMKAAIKEAEAAEAALKAADYGKWKGFYTKGDWLLDFPRTITLSKDYLGKLEGRDVPENVIIRSKDKEFPYHMITAYQGWQKVQF